MLIAVAAIRFLVGAWSAQSDMRCVSSASAIPASALAETRSLFGTSPAEEAAASTELNLGGVASSEPETTVEREKVESMSAASEFVYYRNCSAAQAAGAAPIIEGEAGYAGHLDRHEDGVACE
ncbi:MAG TPA: excalibur calcium-binding domain-containing protein [Sphingomicrobium sp.]|jgi:hypothetical protein